MNIRSVIILIFILVISSVLNAQSPGRRWIELFNGEEKTVYMDTTSIRQIDNQLSVWSLLIYDEPVQKENIDNEVKKIKTQYLINTLTKRYSIIGSLFYDERGRIVGESSIARFGGSNNLTQLVADNPIVTVVMNAAKDFNETGTIEFNESDSELISNYDESNEDLPDPVTDYDNEIDNSDSESDEDSTISDEVENEETNSDSYEEEEQDNEINNQIYNPSVERNVGRMIFTDGSIYVFQVAAYRIRSQAEEKMRTLKNRGYNAFITEAYIPQKGGTWYRVRIGYFNSYNEARNSQRTVR